MTTNHLGQLAPLVLAVALGFGGSAALAQAMRNNNDAWMRQQQQQQMQQQQQRDMQRQQQQEQMRQQQRDQVRRQQQEQVRQQQRDQTRQQQQTQQRDAIRDQQQKQAQSQQQQARMKNAPGTRQPEGGRPAVGQRPTGPMSFSNGVARLNRPLTPGEIQKGFTGKVVNGRALIKFGGRVVTVPESRVAGLRRSALGLPPANDNSRWSPQERAVAQSAVARLSAGKNPSSVQTRIATAQAALASRNKGGDGGGGPGPGVAGRKVGDDNTKRSKGDCNSYPPGAQLPLTCIQQCEASVPGQEPPWCGRRDDPDGNIKTEHPSRDLKPKPELFPNSKSGLKLP